MMDLAMNFDTDECLVTAMFDKGNRWIWKIIKRNWKRRTRNENKSVCSISGKRNTRVS